MNLEEVKVRHNPIYAYFGACFSGLTAVLVGAAVGSAVGNGSPAMTGSLLGGAVGCMAANLIMLLMYFSYDPRQKN
jgi:hypothetical protein